MFTKDLFSFQKKTETKFGEGIFKDLPKMIDGLGYKKVGIIIDPAVYRKKEVKAVVDVMSDRFETIVHEYKLKGEPSYAYLDEAKSEFVKDGHSKVDCFVGIGGGSCMDFAKGLATLVNNEGDAIEYRGFPIDINASLPAIAVPTTSGTGSELAYNAVFVETNEKKKLGINTESNYPVLAILDPELTVSCPRGVTISSGLDALVHTLESFVSKKANDMSRLCSRKAFKLIFNNLAKVVDNPTDIKARARMMKGACWAMIALSNSSSGPTGAMSYLLGAQYDVLHGIA
ncbi:MAG: iron-containing alcohol dehydrogenase, partial [Candidatus Omnitrophica bacterium]|nr:iron-containing alcohol dehydrogenase [Candidatus Omnitrophota bacterium]